MRISPEPEPPITPLESISDAVHTRQEELEFLLSGLQASLEVVADVDRVNKIIAASLRPDLVITEPAEQQQIGWPFRHRQIMNFIPRLQSFGPWVIEMRKEWSRGPEEPKRVYRRLPTSEELDVYRLLGARGDYDEARAFARDNGVDDDIAEDIIKQSAVVRPAFMRMWLLFPSLTERLIANCLADHNTSKNINEELFVAYSIMSRLVDKNDPDVTKEDGSIDNWALCH
jgi:hypothetical protein